MRVEDAGGRTWLYVALAGWALCVWVLALFGMGGSIDRLDDDPSLRQALPSPGARGEERLGPLAQYGDIASRPLFTEDRRPQPFVIDPMGDEGEARGGFDFVLTSVLRTPELQMVILQPADGGAPQRVKRGDAPEGAPDWVLQSVEARRAVFSGPEGSRRLDLRVFDGVGGEAPTPMAIAPDAAGAGAGDPMVADADDDMAAPPRAAAGPQARRSAATDPDTGADGMPAPTAAEQQQAAQEQVEAIRRRIEERRARLRQQETARPPPRANQNP